MRIALILSFLLICLAGKTILSSQNETKESVLYPQGLVTLSGQNPLSPYAFVVDKAKRTLRVYKFDNELPLLLEEHPTDIGKNSGDKTKANDFKTPVGIYFLTTRKTQPEIPFDLYGNLAFTTDYPNIFDKRFAKSGHGIWLHAVPDSVPLTRGSRGCVVVRNNIIKHLEKYVNLGQTPMVIAEQVTYLSKSDYLNQKNKYLAHFEKWRKTWETEDVDSYIQFYDPTFKNAEMNFKQWYRHKKKMKGLYSYIKVQLGQPLILINKDQVVIRTTQRYESDKHRDFGLKTIHANFSDETGFKIVREDWTPLFESTQLGNNPEPTSTSSQLDREVSSSKTN